MKRGIDLLFAIAVIVVMGWALLIVWALIRFGSPGPGIFAQDRVGQHGKTFTCYKFRTMQDGTVQLGTHEVSQSAVTPIGRFLRRTKIDELPQVWNIFKNEISLIGPRPGLPVQTDLFQARQARGVFEVKPGISGLAQVNDIDMSDPEKLAKWDARYIRLQSLILDLKLVLATIRGKGQGDKTSA
ncbi:lipid carrier--UDP-N-acetylgalactosaminyltransferase [Sulfitobacter sp. HI0040]|nr:lipid carrier--UDP-N-acetylgalactosaminyltransferase [Sulfitobacter sp. HI0023]KZY23883.1 lipid carrier--UDP-N-acetylgalactosaminyltransferase [Sulfitobacter sp. HI0040]KZZ67529.1 lipid carrier--UDP-N-acetylgalactosaminyltransferase [Sulfitobacter sp. HI0129]